MHAIEAGPVFVASSTRSGATLMFALLASHPNLSMVRRTDLWRYYYGRYGDLADRANFERCLQDMLHDKRLLHLQPDPERIRREFAQDEPTYGRLFALWHQHYAAGLGKPRWGDKSHNTECYAHQILSEYPNARIIHMLRDPRDRLASIRKRHGAQAGKLGGSTATWLISARLARRNTRRWPTQYFSVRYEDLAQHPEATLHRICAFIGEPYAPEMLSMQGAPEHRQAGNSSFGSLRPGEISTRSLGRFREVLHRDEIAFIQWVAGGYMAALGYALDDVAFPPREWLRFHLIDLPQNLARTAFAIADQAIDAKRGAALPAKRLADVTA